VLANSSHLLVFCSSGSRNLEWVAREIHWWLQHRSGETLLLAVTEGIDPAADPASVFPEATIAERLHNRLRFDLRGWHRHAAANWTKVRDFEQALVNIAAQLNNEQPDELPLWYREQRRRQNRRNLVTSAVALAMLILVAIIFVFQQFGVRPTYRWTGIQRTGTSRVFSRSPCRLTPP
jgi:hypothetical protein